MKLLAWPLALGLVLVQALPAPAAESLRSAPSAGPALVILGLKQPVQPLGHFRLGLAQVNEPGINALLGAQGMALGWDLGLDRGLSVAVDSIAMYRPYERESYLMSISPVQLRYRLALPGATGAIQPYLAAGGGLSLLGLLAGQQTPRAALGLAASAGVGLALNRSWTLELGFDAGRTDALAYNTWQLRLGTGMPDLGRWFAPAPSAPVEHVPGKVEAVSGDELTLRFERPPGLKPGDAVLVSYRDGFPIRVARAVLVSVADNAATARVVAATEPVKRGYDVRAW